MSHELFTELENMRTELALKKIEYAKSIKSMEYEIAKKEMEYNNIYKSSTSGNSPVIVPRQEDIGQSGFDVKNTNLKGIITCSWYYDNMLLCEFKAQMTDQSNVIVWQKRFAITCTFDVPEFQQFLQKVKGLMEIPDNSTNSQIISWRFNKGLFPDEVCGYFVENGRWICRGNMKNPKTSEITSYMDAGTIEQLYHHLMVIGYLIGIVPKKDLPKNVIKII